MPTSPEFVIGKIDTAINRATDGRLSRTFDSWGERISDAADKAINFAEGVLDEAYNSADSITGGIPTAFTDDLNKQIDQLVLEATGRRVSRTSLDRLAQRAQVAAESVFLTLTAPLVTLADDAEAAQPAIAQILADGINRIGAGPAVKRFLQNRGFGRHIGPHPQTETVQNEEPPPLPVIKAEPQKFEPEIKAVAEQLVPSVLYINNWLLLGQAREVLQNRDRKVDITPALDLGQALTFIKTQTFNWIIIDLVPDARNSQRELDRKVLDFVRNAAMPQQLTFKEDLPSRRDSAISNIQITKPAIVNGRNIVYLSIDQPRQYISTDGIAYELSQDPELKIIRGQTLALDAVVRMILGEKIPVLRPIQPEITEIKGFTPAISTLPSDQLRSDSLASSTRPNSGIDGKPLVVDWSAIFVDLRFPGALHCLHEIIESRQSPHDVDLLNALFRVLEQMKSTEVELLDPEKLTSLWKRVKSGELKPALVTKIFD